MVGYLTAATGSSTPVIVFCALAALVLGSWGWGKYREYRAAKRSEEIRNLYATVHADRVTGKTTDRRTSSPA
jgi:hypothetical protein